MGKLAFCPLKDPSGEIQLYIEKKALEEAASPLAFTDLKNLVDTGDIVGATGAGGGLGRGVVRGGVGEQGRHVGGASGPATPRRGVY